MRQSRTIRVKRKKKRNLPDLVLFICKPWDSRTLELYLDHIQKEQAENVNGSAITLLYMIKQYGFDSLEEANEKIKSRIQ